MIIYFIKQDRFRVSGPPVATPPGIYLSLEFKEAFSLFDEGQTHLMMRRDASIPVLGV